MNQQSLWTITIFYFLITINSFSSQLKWGYCYYSRQDTIKWYYFYKDATKYEKPNPFVEDQSGPLQSGINILDEKDVTSIKKNEYFSYEYSNSKPKKKWMNQRNATIITNSNFKATYSTIQPIKNAIKRKNEIDFDILNTEFYYQLHDNNKNRFTDFKMLLSQLTINDSTDYYICINDERSFSLNIKQNNSTYSYLLKLQAVNAIVPLYNVTVTSGLPKNVKISTRYIWLQVDVYTSGDLKGVMRIKGITNPGKDA